MIFLFEHGWSLLNIALSITVACAGVYMVIAYADEIGSLERVGISSICAGALLTIGPILMRSIFNGSSPFDDWSASLMRLGCATYFVGWMWRLDHNRWAALWRGIFRRLFGARQ